MKGKAVEEAAVAAADLSGNYLPLLLIARIRLPDHQFARDSQRAEMRPLAGE